MFSRRTREGGGNRSELTQTNLQFKMAVSKLREEKHTADENACNGG